MQNSRYYALSAYLKTRYGKRVRKVPLDAGSSCPNRDGAASKSGCVFCNSKGTGTGLHERGMSLAQQWSFLTDRIGRKYKTDCFWAYLQSFTNTYGPLARVRALMRELAVLPDMRLVSLGTRPDCLDKEKLRCIADWGIPEIWLDIGLQSSNDLTLRRINRGHDFACFAHCVEEVRAQGLHVCVHVVHGLPGETSADFLRTIRDVSRLPVSGIKFHNLFVASGSTLEDWWRKGAFVPGEMDEYVQAVGESLNFLRPDIIVHRLNADPGPGELLAPQWAADKTRVLNAIQRHLEVMNCRQGSQCRETNPHRRKGTFSTGTSHE
ncbi:hypothetical protein SAMN05660653_01319 [Desulfonatronum thiosulfatophilum]|uniref:Radical SAM core domain-containing protein n=1 Tax=Desulfonatronum thiosulfatophilum TaxID=617002 RepID=A0A1G6C2Z5_9BACT|nr:TIGR01212 family radical SAM protein [Desulfonatronum thiosulfatophilum]SDB27186.1 hypothetical protein SAMN05660653_01319 [Desulfonatronum thiosulfatophilum]